MRDKDGGQAFPVSAERGSFTTDSMGYDHATPHKEREEGMILRDYFAGQALAGYSASDELWDTAKHDMLAREAYKAADAMIAERGNDE